MNKTSTVTQQNGAVLLHLSDLHFGHYNRFRTQNLAEFGQQFGVAVRNAVNEQKWNRSAESPLDLIIVSGDIAETALPSEFDQGNIFLTAVAKELGVHVDRVIIIPGNHDLSWRKCKIIQEQLEGEEITNDEYPSLLNKAKFEPYRKFLQKFYSWPDDNMPSGMYESCFEESGLYIRDFAIGPNNLPVSIACLNSSEKETHINLGGEVTKEQAQFLMNKWLESKYDPYLKIVVVHHNPLVTPSANQDWTDAWLESKMKDGSFKVEPAWLRHYSADMVGFKGREHLERVVRQTNAHLVLHGHHHTPSPASLWPCRNGGISPVLSVGSFGLESDKIPPEQPLTCQIICFSQKPKANMNAVVLQYDPAYRLDDNLNKGQFRLNDKSESAYSHRFNLPSGWVQSQTHSKRGTHKKISELSSTRIDSVVDNYRQRLEHIHSVYDLKSLGVVPGENRKTREPKLDDLYLPLRFNKSFDLEQTDQGDVLDSDSIWELLTEEVSLTSSSKAFPRIRKSYLALTGVAGSGKTTWMRYTFRRLLKDSRFLPFSIELRRVAQFWKDSPRSQRSIEAYLAHWLEEYYPTFKDSGISIHTMLVAQASWFPILMVDGWDELGTLGDEFREKLLGLLSTYPRLLTITSSRPYGSGRPTNSEGFQQLQIQPLSSSEISSFTMNFYSKCYEDEEHLVREQVKAFEVALGRSNDAKMLAKTPLLLTMMLFINRSKRLPDKRHQLYEECLLSLLSERPEMQQDQGAQLGIGEWCPTEKGKGRLQVVARLAFDLQTRHEQDEQDAQDAQDEQPTPIVVHRSQLKAYLPPEWEDSQKEGFLLWLCSRAGVMVEDSQDNVWFAHLSFQEFLSAWHLNNNYVGNDASNAFFDWAKNPQWWETLMLWIALLNDQSFSRAEVLLEQALEREYIVLSCMILADGVGTLAQMERGANLLRNQLLVEWPEQMERCLRAWAAVPTNQNERLKLLINVLIEAMPKVDWIKWIRFKEVLDKVRNKEVIQFNRPCSLDQTPILAFLSSTIVESPEEFAGSRSASGCHALWPSYPCNLLLLWPSRRKELSLRIQRLALYGASYEELLKCLQHFVAGLFINSEYLEQIDSFFAELESKIENSDEAEEENSDEAEEENSDEAEEENSDEAEEENSDEAEEENSDEAEEENSDEAEEENSDEAEEENSDEAEEGIGYEVEISHEDNEKANIPLLLMVGFTSSIADSHALIDEFDLKNEKTGRQEMHARNKAVIKSVMDRFNSSINNHEMVKYVNVNLQRLTDNVRGRIDSRVSLFAHRSISNMSLIEIDEKMNRYFLSESHMMASLSNIKSVEDAMIDERNIPILLQIVASRLAILKGEENKNNFDQVIFAAQNFQCDPLWIALARYVVGLSSSEDKDLLEDLASNPDKREAPLSWGLRFMVRGDILLSNGEFVTFDKICDDAGIERLPLLEPMMAF